MVVRRECVGTIQIQLIYSPISTWFPLINYLTNIYRGYLVGSTVRPYFKAFTVIFHKFGSIYWFFLIKNFLYVGIYHRLGGMSRLWHVPNRKCRCLDIKNDLKHLFGTSIWNIHLKPPFETSIWNIHGLRQKLWYQLRKEIIQMKTNYVVHHIWLISFQEN